MADTTKHGHEHHGDANPQVSHERRDVNVFQITAFGIGLLIACIVVAFAMWGMFAFLAHREDTASPESPMAKQKQTLPPEPRLSGVKVENGQRDPHPVYPHDELQDLRDSEDAILNNYGWVDPGKGTVRIPVDEAITIVSQKGLPSRVSPAGAEGGFRMIPSDASSGRTLEKISQ
jgi:hypothetical protein